MIEQECILNIVFVEAKYENADMHKQIAYLVFFSFDFGPVKMLMKFVYLYTQKLCWDHFRIELNFWNLTN